MDAWIEITSVLILEPFICRNLYVCIDWNGLGFFDKYFKIVATRACAWIEIKLWMKMYYPDVSPQFLDDCYGYILLAFWSGVDYANENKTK